MHANGMKPSLPLSIQKRAIAHLKAQVLGVLENAGFLEELK
jgi:hypothetical protein